MQRGESVHRNCWATALAIALENAATSTADKIAINGGSYVGMLGMGLLERGAPEEKPTRLYTDAVESLCHIVTAPCGERFAGVAPTRTLSSPRQRSRSGGARSTRQTRW